MSAAIWGWVAVGVVSIAVALWANLPSAPKPSADPFPIPRQRKPQ
ncbi:hypothetical protein [Streptomyces abikoensis]|uniref:Secreted protein n=1 Tax=Streptomyces abikoensis TaxID=97398 RepID=A0ABW7TAF5_9ACTN